jgi:hypothetical protein
MLPMRAIKLSLLLGGLFNITMGAIFFSNSLLLRFFQATGTMERMIFGKQAELVFPSNPLHQLLIHGFGAGVMILGATLIFCYRDPKRFLPFILFDALGRLLYGSTMIYSVFKEGLIRMILVFGSIELAFAVAYLCATWYLTKKRNTVAM